MSKYFFQAFTLLLLITGLLWWWHPDNVNKLHYVSSAQCRECHSSHHAGWQESLHPKIFAPASEKEILADFSLDDPDLTFTKQDVEYVVGGKWEQIYARMIDGEYYPLPAKWLVAERRWVSYRVDSWQDTPMSKKCNGCHVTGFDTATYEFVEYGVGCEACHGQGSAHINNRRIENSRVCRICHREPRPTEGDIVSSVSGAVCGQCHNRGKSIPDSARTQAVFSFPVDMAPGETMSPSFELVGPAGNENNKYWWGNGVARKRHQEFAEWEKSNHALSLTRMRELYRSDKGPVTAKCLDCHSTDHMFMQTDNAFDMHSARYGITCVVCHNPHGDYNSRPAQQTDSAACTVCHMSDHSSCPSPALQPHFPCPADKVSCEDCHMPFTVRNAGSFSIRSHGFKIVSPIETKKFMVPNSCQNGSCHRDKNQEWAESQFSSFYPDYPGGED